jgi:hypothetical protein
MIARDAYSDLLFLRGNTAAAVENLMAHQNLDQESAAESGLHPDGISSLLGEGIDAFVRQLDTLSRKHRKAVTKIDLRDGGWLAGLQGFVETLAAHSLEAGLDDRQLADLIREAFPSGGQFPNR